MSKVTAQKGYIDLDGFLVAFAVVLVVLGAGLGLLVEWGWPVVKAWIHGVTA